jgi:hypothetical protein
LNQVRRFDVGSISRAELTPQGYLRAPAIATRVGVFKYRQPDGSIRRELRLPEEVFKEDSFKTLSLVPLTNQHPPDLLTPKNTKEFIVGVTSDTPSPDAAAGTLGTTITIMDQKAINDVNDGKQELSCGYSCNLEDSPGVYDGEPYDFIQRNIKYNHLAIVGKGRAGPQARIHLDSADAVMVSTNNPEEDNMEKVKVNGKEHEVNPDLAKDLKSHMEAMDKAMKDMQDKYDVAIKEKGKGGKTVEESNQEDDKEKLAEDLEKSEAKKDALEDEVKSLKKQLSTRKDESDVKAAVKARIAMEKIAEKVGVEKFDDMSDLDLKKAVIKTQSKDANLDGKSEIYIDARFDAIAESLPAKGTKTVTEIGRGLMNPSVNNDEEIPDADAIRKKRMDEDTAAWSKPIGKASPTAAVNE